MKPNLDFISSFQIGDVTYESNLAEDLKINKGNLQDAFETHAERFAFYTTAYELALDYELRLSAEVDRLYAKCDEAARSQLAANGIKVTEKMVENVVITTPEYIEAQKLLFDAKKNAGLLKAAKDAMIARKDMLVSFGANIRAELNADPMIVMDKVRKNRS